MSVYLETQWNDKYHSCRRLSRDTVEVIVFDFHSQLLDLLGDCHLFGNMDNLVVNKDAPGIRWKPYETNGIDIFEVLDGEWYQIYARIQVVDETSQYSCPKGLYRDGSETVVYQRCSLQPFIMFPLILNCKAYNKKSSSRVLAVIPDLEAKSSAIKMAAKQGNCLWKGHAIQNYHRCMDVALRSYQECQQAGGAIKFLRLGKICK
jgi:hypothetical protein